MSKASQNVPLYMLMANTREYTILAMVLLFNGLTILGAAIPSARMLPYSVDGLPTYHFLNKFVGSMILVAAAMLGIIAVLRASKCDEDPTVSITKHFLKFLCQWLLTAAVMIVVIYGGSHLIPYDVDTHYIARVVADVQKQYGLVEARHLQAKAGTVAALLRLMHITIWVTSFVLLASTIVGAVRVVRLTRKEREEQRDPEMGFEEEKDELLAITVVTETTNLLGDDNDKPDKDPETGLPVSNRIGFEYHGYATFTPAA